MEVGSDSGDFGVLLENARLELGISRETLSRLTRIPVSIITSLENSDHYSLPQRVYVNGFIKACCSALDMDEKTILAAYDESLRIHLQKSGPGMSRLASRRTLLLMILLVLCLVALNQYVREDFFKEEKKEMNPEAEITEEMINNADQAGSSEETKIREITLTIQGHDKAVVKLIIDGDFPKRIEITEGSRFDFKARKNFNLLIEDPKNVDLAFDGKPYTVPGNDQVINIFYP